MVATQNDTSEGLKGPRLREALHERSQFGGPDVSIFVPGMSHEHVNDQPMLALLGVGQLAHSADS